MLRATATVLFWVFAAIAVFGVAFTGSMLLLTTTMELVH